METVTLKVPKVASSGEKYAVVWAQVAAASSTRRGVLLVNRVGIRMYVSVGLGGLRPPSFTIGPLSAKRSTTGEPFVAVTIHNTGEGRLGIRGSLTLSNGPGGVRGGPYPVTLSSSLAPGRSELATVALSKQLPDGPWKASIRLVSGPTVRSATATLTFPGVTRAPPRPSQFVTLVVIVLLVWLASIAAGPELLRCRASSWTDRRRDVTDRKQAERPLQGAGHLRPSNRPAQPEPAKGPGRPGCQPCRTGTGPGSRWCSSASTGTEWLPTASGTRPAKPCWPSSQPLAGGCPDRTVARVGGDVFAVVVEGAGAVAGTVEWAQRQFRSASRHRFEVDGSELYVAFSTGIAFSGPGISAEDLVRNAEVAMSRAKEAGGAKVVAFEERDLEAVRERLALETDLRHALAEGQIPGGLPAGRAH